MDRLTYMDGGKWRMRIGDTEYSGEAVDRLAAYEETGMEPEDILSATDMAKVACALHELNQYKELGDLDRLRELVEADREGRCVVLPCKVGDAIYEIVRHRNSGTVEIIQYFVNAVETSGDSVTVKSHRWRPTSTGLLSEKVPNWVKSSDFGKTVFLTREAAEAALKGEQDG